MRESSIQIFILGLPRWIKRLVVVAIDIFLCALTVWASFGLRVDYWGSFTDSSLKTLFFSIAISLPIFYFHGLYLAIFRYMGSIAIRKLIRAFVFYSCTFLVCFTVIGVNGVPRAIGVIQPMLLFIAIGSSRYFARSLLFMSGIFSNKLERRKPRALIYGAGASGRQLVAALVSSREIDVLGFIDDNKSLHGNTIDGTRVYSPDELQELIFALKISDVLLALPSADQRRRGEVIEALSAYRVRVRSVPSLLDMVTGQPYLIDLRELDMNDLLGRSVIPPDIRLLTQNITNKIVLVTGAGGSIGSELCRQILQLSPSQIILVDISEHGLYQIFEDLKHLLNGVEIKNSISIQDDEMPVITPVLGSVSDQNRMSRIFSKYKPFIVFHAAAYKHVPLVEDNVGEGIVNNVFGTLTCAQLSIEFGVSYFVLISTDKAVRPTNIMGASKRVAELVLQALADKAKTKELGTEFSMVRFGNVLGSSGSVAPLFTSQIKKGGPITLTHPDVIRYFMTIPEAAQLVIQASAMVSGGEVFVLDMGAPVRIYDLAVKMIYLSGLMLKDKDNPQGDIEIKVTGLRPGETLYEELLIGNNPKRTIHPKIMKAHEDFLPWHELEGQLEDLKRAINGEDIQEIRFILEKLVSGYSPNNVKGFEQI